MPLHVIAVINAVTALFALAASLPARATDGGAFDHLDRLTPQALVQAVEASNAHLQAHAAAAQAAALRIEPSGALDDPRLTYALPPNTIGGEAGFRSVVELRQALPWPGTRDLRRSVAEESAGAASEDLAIARLDVIAAAKAAYAEWFYVHRAMEINDSSRALLIEHARIAEGRYAAGRAPQQDVLQAEVEELLLQEQRRTLEQQRTTLRARINALLGRAPATTLPPPADLPDPDTLPDIEHARAAAARSHPELRQVQHEIAGADARARLAEKAFFPSFDVNLGYNEMWPDRDMRLMLGVAINVPLQRSRRRAELDAALAERRRSQHVLADQTAVLLATLESAHARSAQAMDVIRLYEQRVLVLVDRNVEAAVTAYQSGAGQFLTVVAAERQRLATRQTYERARADYWRARAELEQATGGAVDTAARPSVSR